MITIGLEALLAKPPTSLNKARIGLLTNQASVASNLEHNRILLQKQYGAQLTTLFSPQHGFFAEKQDNMIESDHMVDEETGLKIFSLYGDVRKPTHEMFADLDALLIDIVDVGTRVYTFLYTMAYCLETASELGKKVVVLDRPNPIDGQTVEGNLLEDEFRSFVGMFAIPMRHGLTFGELALLINTEYNIGADLEIVPMQGWRREMYFQDTGFPWVFPSPNMPTPFTAEVYPGQVIWEGTNISEGRGTTLPFELFGSPFIEQERVLKHIQDKYEIEGCYLRPLAFQPTSGKWAGEVCQGFQIHVTDRKKFLPYRTSLIFLQAFLELYPDEFQYKKPPYEYEYVTLPMDLILGSGKLRKSLESSENIITLEENWSEQVQEYQSVREKYFLYRK